MKKRLPAIVTALLIAGALVFFAARQRLKTAEPAYNAANPESVIWRMSDAARAGDVGAYLNCFDGELRRNLEKTAAEMGERQFGEYLKRLNGEITGIAVSDLDLTGDAGAKLRVEFVYRGKNEAQRHYLTLRDGAWKIDRVDESERVKTLIPYGADATGKE
ncbi:MAG TPA: hypothetical protein VJ810_34535 [Blastocatellia bacterium]|nr:hypothetical protein [Blastocatellia bacterium]